MNVHVDELKCMKAGYCVRVAPAVFSLDGNVNHAVVQTATLSPDQEDLVFEAETLCPMLAISVDI